jgi:serine/threonine protein kinase
MEKLEEDADDTESSNRKDSNFNYNDYIGDRWADEREFSSENKDITDITDAEKADMEGDNGDNDDNGKSLVRSSSKSKTLPVNKHYDLKKKFVDENNDMCDLGMPHEHSAQGQKRIPVEKSPKERFARFEDELGSGAFKRVYRGWDYDTGREVAWSVINVNFMSDEAVNKIRDEIAIIKKLNHPNIMNFISGFFNEEKKEVVIITEIFSGGSLKQHLNKIKYPRLKVIKGWCKEILKGLKYLHEQENPIIHRDIKCDNIFINSNNGQIKIGDLGYSCVLFNDEDAKTVSGTPEFMAPEVLTGKYNTLADIYSFGICVLEMITAEKPYKECENNVLAVFENTKNHILPKSLDKIKNQKIVEFIKWCLEPVETRPTADVLLNSEFLNDLTSEDVNYPPMMNCPCDENGNILSMANASYYHPAHGIGPSHTTHGRRSEDKNTRMEREFKEMYRGGKPGEEISTNYGKNSKSNKIVGQLPFNVRESTDSQQNFQSHVSPFEIAKNHPHNNQNNQNNHQINLNYHASNSNLIQVNSNGANEIVGLRPSKRSTLKLNHENHDQENYKKRESNYSRQYTNNYQGSSSEDLDHEMSRYSPQFRKSDKFENDIYYKEGVLIPKVRDSNFNRTNPKYMMSNPSSTTNQSKKISPFARSTKLFTNSSISSNKTLLTNKTSLNSNIEAKIEVIYEEDKQNPHDPNIIKISLFKKAKNAKKKQIFFDFNLTTDTCDGVVKELERDIGFTEEEAEIIKYKLQNLIVNYTNTIGKGNYHAERDEEFVQVKAFYDKFMKKYNKIMHTAEDLVKNNSHLREEINKNQDFSDNSNDNEIEFLEKMKFLENFLKKS